MIALNDLRNYNPFLFTLFFSAMFFILLYHFFSPEKKLLNLFPSGENITHLVPSEA